MHHFWYIIIKLVKCCSDFGWYDSVDFKIERIFLVDKFIKDIHVGQCLRQIRTRMCTYHFHCLCIYIYNSISRSEKAPFKICLVRPIVMFQGFLHGCDFIYIDQCISFCIQIYLSVFTNIRQWWIV